MRRDLTLLVNGRRPRLGPDAASRPLSAVLRDDLHLVGTKVGCGEGDCGACTVLVGRPEGGAVRYRPVASCVALAAQMDASHVVTIEGVGGPAPAGPTPIQRALVDHHGSQCGYCTPGVVMALTAAREAGADDPRRWLAGNLCRCTGYLPILEAARSVAPGAGGAIGSLYEDAPIFDDLSALARDELRIESGPMTSERPASAGRVAEILGDDPAATIVAGGTDLGVWRARRGDAPTHLVAIGGVEEWSRVVRGGGATTIGAGVTWARLAESLGDDPGPLAAIARSFATPQVRSVATFVGNVADATPSGDSIAYLHLVDATLRLIGAGGARDVPIRDYLAGYRATRRRPGEVVAEVRVPDLDPGDACSNYKVHKRKDMDETTLRLAIRVADGPAGIRSSCLYASGVSDAPIRLDRAEACLASRPFSAETFRAAGRVAREEAAEKGGGIDPDDFRMILIENLLTRFHLDAAPAGGGASTDAR